MVPHAVPLRAPFLCGVGVARWLRSAPRMESGKKGFSSSQGRVGGSVLCFVHEGDQRVSADVMGVCRILLPDSWHIRAPFPCADGPGRRRRSPCFTRLAGLERGRCTAQKARTGSKWEALLITWGQMVCPRLSGTLCPK